MMVYSLPRMKVLGIFWCEIVSSSVSLDLCLWKCAWRSFSDESKVLAITLDDKVSVAGIEQLASDLLPSRQFGHIVLHLGAQNDRDFGRAQCIPKFHVYIYIFYIHININMDIIMNLNVYIDLYTYVHLYTMLSPSLYSYVRCHSCVLDGRFWFLACVIARTTTYGIMDHEEARRKHVGGKIVGFFF